MAKNHAPNNTRDTNHPAAVEPTGLRPTTGRNATTGTTGAASASVDDGENGAALDWPPTTEPVAHDRRADEWLNKNHLGDCLDLMSQLPDGSVDLIVTSPPYNLRRSTGGGCNGRGLWPRAALRNGYEGDTDDMPRDKYIAWQRACLTEMMRLLPDAGAIFYNHKRRVQDGIEEDPRVDILYDFPVRQTITWVRSGGINFSLSYFLPTTELIYLIPKSEKFRLAQSPDPKRPNNRGLAAMGDVWYEPQERKNPHPAPFPIAIPRRCIEATDARVILDPFMGSGSTALAAEMLGRKWIGFEKAPKYIDQANTRFTEWCALTPEAKHEALIRSRLRSLDYAARKLGRERAPGSTPAEAVANGPAVDPSAATHVDAQPTAEQVASSDAPKSVGAAEHTPASSPVASTIPVGRLEERDPKALDEHPLLRKLFELGSDEANEELLESVHGRQYRPVLVTGVGCASPPNTVLDGRRLRRVALKLGLPVRVEVLDGLTAEMEAKVTIHANIASGLARRYDEQAKAALVRYYIEAFGKRQGERTDLTSVQTHGSVRRETPQIVADKIREEFGDDVDVTPTAIQEGQIIFYGPTSSGLLKEAVRSGKIKRRPAADLVRKVQKEPEVAAVIKEARANGTPMDVLSAHPVIVAAQRKVFVEAEKILGKKGSKKNSPPKPIIKTEAWGTVVEGAVAIDNFLGHKVLVQIEDGKVHLVDLGPADADPGIYVPGAPTTRATWAVDVAAAVNELPPDLCVSVSDVEVLEPASPCAKCGGTRFFEGGGCARCQPLRLPNYSGIDDQVEQEVAGTVGPKEWAIYKNCLGFNAKVLGRPLSSEERGTNTVVLRVGIEIDNRKRAARAAADEEARQRDPRLGNGFKTRIQDLRHQRTRVRIATPNGEIPIVLWEREADWMPHGAHPKSPCVVIPHSVVPIYLCADDWSRRAHLRQKVRDAIMRTLASERGIAEEGRGLRATV